MAQDSSPFTDRRRKLTELIGDSIAVLPAGREQIRNHDVAYEFRQDSAFWYLTGLEEPDAYAIVDPVSPDEPYVLFVRPRDREEEIWSGYRVGVEGAKRELGANAAYPNSDFERELAARLVGHTAVYAPLGNRSFVSAVLKALDRARAASNRYGSPAPTEIRDIRPILDELRIRKSAADLESLRAACDVTARGHCEAMRYTRPGLREYQVQAAMEYMFRVGGSARNGYPSIVASGPNACILHYEENRALIAEDDLLLIDAGAEVDYFSSDITRTFPAGGRFSSPQRAIYELVLSAQHAALARCRPDESLEMVHREAAEIIAAGLVHLGLLPGPVDRVLATHQYREFFMHGTSHWLGVDVHDVGSYGVDDKPRGLEPGMTFTVEPGVYVSPDRDEVKLSLLEYDQDEWTRRRMLLGKEAAKAKEREERERAGWVAHRVPEELRGIGVRIEDDVLVTDAGHEVLTSGVPSDPDDVEAMCAESSTFPLDL